MAFGGNYKISFTHQGLNRYKEEVEACRGIDPSELVESECSDDVKLWP